MQFFYLPRTTSQRYYKRVFLEEFSSSFSETYRIDKKPDVNGYACGRPNPDHVPNYRRYTYNVLGYTGKEKLFDNVKKKKRRDKFIPGTANRYFSKENVLILSQSSTSIKSASENLKGDYIAFSVDEDDKPDLVNNPIGVYDVATTKYISGL